MDRWISEFRKLLSWKELRYIWNTGNTRKKFFVVLSLAVIFYIGSYILYCFFLIFTGDISAIFSLFGLLIVFMLGYWLLIAVRYAKYNPLTNKIRQTREKRIKEKEKEEEDRKYVYVVNCPSCNGTGEAYISNAYNDREGTKRRNELVTRKQYKHQKKTGKLYLNGLWLEQGDSGITGRISLEVCPFCKGDGTAFAWFEKEAEVEKTCVRCNGIGTFESRIKQEVGADCRTTPCGACNGKGKNIIIKDLVHVKAMYDGCWVDSSEVGPYDFNFGSILSEHGDDCSIFSIELTDLNRSFFSKKRPRFSSED